MTKLTKAQHFLLDWLSNAETSVLGECRGPDLDELVTRGFAEIDAPSPLKHRWGTRPGPDYDRVRITDAGCAALAQPVQS